MDTTSVRSPWIGALRSFLIAAMTTSRRLTELKLSRLRRGVRQMDVAFAAHIAQPRLSMLENGYVEPRLDELERLAMALETSVEALRGAHAEYMPNCLAE